MKKVISKFLREESGFIAFFIASMYYSRWAIYRILPAFFNPTDLKDHLLIAFGLIFLFTYIVLSVWAIACVIGRFVTDIRNYKNPQKKDEE